MKLCIPIADAGGLGSAFDPDFGAARYLVIVDTDSGITHTVDRHQPEQVTDELVADIGAVLCGEIHPRLLHELQHNGIQVYGSDADTAATALAQFKAGELALAVGPHAHGGHGGCCGGHGEHHAHGHDEAGCCGRGGHGHSHGEGECCGGQGGHGAHQCACSGDHED